VVVVVVGSVVLVEGSVVLVEGSVVLVEGSVVLVEGSVVLVEGSVVLVEGSVVEASVVDGSVVDSLAEELDSLEAIVSVPAVVVRVVPDPAEPELKEVPPSPDSPTAHAEKTKNATGRKATVSLRMQQSLTIEVYTNFGKAHHAGVRISRRFCRYAVNRVRSASAELAFNLNQTLVQGDGAYLRRVPPRSP
jgi:hypothetical protein